MANQNALQVAATIIPDGSSTSVTVELLKHPLITRDALQNFWGVLSTAYTPTGVYVQPNDPYIASASIVTLTQIVTLTLKAALPVNQPVELTFWVTFAA